uniref:ornithine decarboxylase n=1 Tax=Anopheles darlingi TaxID=43151 RepID=A0A2M4CWA0_ANODA
MELFNRITSSTECVADCVHLNGLIDRTVAAGPHEPPIHILEVDTIVSQYTEWLRCLPRVRQYYAIKSNDADTVVDTITLLGAGFDCASLPEIERVIGLGVSPRSIIYAQPSKSIQSLCYIRNKGIRTVFDNEFELEKIATHCPEAELLLRYRFDSTNVKVNLGSKFGCDPDQEAKQLLNLSRNLRLNVVGWCFNVGSMSSDAAVFYDAIRTGRTISDYARSIGFDFRVIDLGGGFIGDKDDNIERYAKHINRALEEFFPDPSLEVFAEPGRYLCDAAVTTVCTVQGKRYIRTDGQINTVGYYLNDGIYGTFYSAKYRGMVPNVLVWKAKDRCGPKRKSKLFGPTCDGNDHFMDNVMLPELEIGDILVFETQGAYSAVHSCRFNGFLLPKMICYSRDSLMQLLKQIAAVDQMDVKKKNEILLSSEYLRTHVARKMLLCFERK